MAITILELQATRDPAPERSSFITRIRSGLVHGGPGSELVWGEPAQAGVRAAGIIVGAPCSNDAPGSRQAGKDVPVETFIAKPADQAFRNGILHRLARCNVVPADAAILLPAQYRTRRQLSAIITHNEHWRAARLDDALELSDHATSTQRNVYHERQAFAGEVINHDQHAETASISQYVGDEVQAPALVRPLRQRHRSPRSKSTFPPGPPPHHQPLLAIEPEQLLVVEADPLAP